MAEEKKTAEFPLDKEEATRATPRTGAEEHAKQRDRTSELPANEVIKDDLTEMRKEANNTANQTTEEGSVEVEGKLAVPHVKVQRRGSTIWTDEDGEVHKELNDEEPNANIGEEAVPLYLQLHQEVLDGADPLEATLDFANKDEEELHEGTLENAELHPRTMGRDEAEAARKAEEENR